MVPFTAQRADEICAKKNAGPGSVVTLVSINHSLYRGTSLTRTPPPLGPFRRSIGEGAFSYPFSDERGTPVHADAASVAGVLAAMKVMGG